MFATEQHVFIHFMNFPAILVQVHFYPHPHPPPTHPPVKQWKKFFSMDLSISWNFLQFWFRCISPPPPTPHPPTHPLAKQWKKNFFHGFIHFMKFPAILVQVYFLPHPPTHQPNRENKIFSMDLSISWNFLQFWFRCVFYPPPPHPTHPPVKQWEDFFFHGFIHFMKFLAYMTIACRYVEIWDQLVVSSAQCFVIQYLRWAFIAVPRNGSIILVLRDRMLHAMHKVYCNHSLCQQKITEDFNPRCTWNSGSRDWLLPWW